MTDVSIAKEEEERSGLMRGLFVGRGEGLRIPRRGSVEERDRARL